MIIVLDDIHVTMGMLKNIVKNYCGVKSILVLIKLVKVDNKVTQTNIVILKVHITLYLFMFVSSNIC